MKHTPYSPVLKPLFVEAVHIYIYNLIGKYFKKIIYIFTKYFTNKIKYRL